MITKNYDPKSADKSERVLAALFGGRLYEGDNSDSADNAPNEGEKAPESTEPSKESESVSAEQGEAQGTLEQEIEEKAREIEAESVTEQPAGDEITQEGDDYVFLEDVQDAVFGGKIFNPKVI